MPESKDVNLLTAEHDRHNLETIEYARDAGRIDGPTAEYLSHLYADGMSKYREVFHILGKCLGAPKAAVMEYDSVNDVAVNKPINIADINPLSAYLVNHRLDADPMRNQFFTSGTAHKIDLSVSSIVTVIVASQKDVGRAIDKITGKYYRFFIDDVVAVASKVLSEARGTKFASAMVEKIRAHFAAKYMTDASEQVLALVTDADKSLIATLVRELDRITKPYLRLNDVWRVKCLFDLVPQARTFIERLHDMMPERVLTIRDKFYDIGNPRNYRDSKIIINIGSGDIRIPMEIICQVRTFFEYERKTHDYYDALRQNPSAKNKKLEQEAAKLMENGIERYNMMICRCLDDLLDRVGWNILYSRGGDISLFEGFPRECKLYWPQNIIDIIMEKLDTAVQNEIFRITHSSSKLDMSQQIAIFRFMARFVLVAAMPQMNSDHKIGGNSLTVRLFNFIMKEVSRYCGRDK
jgi:hypothetical protein